MFRRLKRWTDALPERRLLIGRLLGVAIVSGAVVAGIRVYQEAEGHPTTNDAMVRANLIDVVLERVNGRIVQLNVVDNQRVSTGELLYQIDPRPYQAQLELARAELWVAEKEVEAKQAQIGAAGARIRQSEQEQQAAAAEIARLGAKADYAADYLKRIGPLVPKQYVSTDAFNQATADRDAAMAAVADARAKHQATAKAVEAAVQVRAMAEADQARTGQVFARIEAAKARLRSAELDLDYCSVRSPIDGYVTNLNIAVGQYVQPGQKLFAIVDDRTWYVIANYKETYLRAIAPGMAVDVFLAPYPGRHFRGEVQGIGWANYPDNVKTVGALPEVERTLNWVVLAARFPVRITLLERDPDHPFRMGMSAYTTVLGHQ